MTGDKTTEGADESEGGELNVNEPPTVAEVMAFLAQFPGELRVSIYEGEGGNWLLVHGRGWKP